MTEIHEARKLAKELFDKNVNPFTIISQLNDKFKGFYYLVRGNVFKSDLDNSVADLVYDRNYERSNND